MRFWQILNLCMPMKWDIRSIRKCIETGRVYTVRWGKAAASLEAEGKLQDLKMRHHNEGIKKV